MSSTNDRLEKIFELEKEVVDFLNAKGWDLTHTGKTMLPYDAKGFTPKGKKCVVEMKFRNKYYDTKMMEFAKFDTLIKMDSDILKFYYVADPKADWVFLLNDLVDIDTGDFYCASKTMWASKKQNKTTYLLKEEESIIKYNRNAVN